MKRIILSSSLMLGLLISSQLLADDKAAMIANAESAAPDSVTANATIKGPDNFRLSYMLAGEGSAIGNSNSDPYATEPENAEDWIKEGPHLMIVVPNRATLEGSSRNPNDPVYVMRGDTPYAHIMVKIAADE